MADLLKLHIGGEEAKDSWKILNVLPGPYVDYLGNCMDLSQFADGSASDIYLSHVLEHLDYQKEVFVALAEFHRVLIPGGRLMIGVPDLEVLCHLLTAPFFPGEAKFHVMRMIYGGQTTPYDYHKAGYTLPILRTFLEKNGFERTRRVETFGLFKDTTLLRFNGVPISLNVETFRRA